MMAAHRVPAATTTTDRLSSVRDDIEQLRGIIARVERAQREAPDDDSP